MSEQELNDALEMAGLPALEVVKEQGQTYDGREWVRFERIWMKLGKPFLGQLCHVKNANLSVFICIALHMNEAREAWPSERRISDLTGYSQRTVRSAIRDLEAQELVQTIKDGRKNLYIISGFFAFGKSKPEIQRANSGNPLPVNSGNPLPPKKRQEKKRQEEVARPKNGRAQPELSAFDALFSELTGLPIPSPHTEKERKAEAARWYQPVRRMVALADGSSADILREAVGRMKHDRLTIAGPRSVESTFTAIFGERKTPPPTATPTAVYR